MTVPIVTQPNLPPNTIVPTDKDLFISYFNRTYEDIAFSVNNRDFIYFTTSISSSAVNIPNLQLFGAYLVAVSGQLSTLPTATWSLCKSSASASGSVVLLGHQAGTGAWAGITLTITSTATNFQIAHNNAGVVGLFNIRIVGTQ